MRPWPAPILSKVRGTDTSNAHMFLKAQAHPPKIQIQTCTSERICDYKPRRGVSWPRLLFLANVCVAFCSAVMNDIMIEENKVNKKSDEE